MQKREALKKQIVEIDRRLLHLKRSVDGLDALLDHQEKREIELPEAAALPLIDRKTGLTQAIRKIFQTSNVLNATVIRDVLKRSGFKTDRNVLIMIHGNLKRMAYSGELRPIKDGGITVYEWKGILQGELERDSTAVKRSPLGKRSFKPR
ncbi:MAG: hypothetical protein ACRD4I_03295 [Candidatus Angelobacter sp.]